jgi:hypothetical protein
VPLRERHRHGRQDEAAPYGQASRGRLGRVILTVRG